MGSSFSGGCGAAITYEFDTLNRKTKKIMPDASQTVSYSYDLRGLMKTALFTSNNQGITNTFDGFGNLKTSTNTMGGYSRALTYRYDENNNRTRVIHPDGHFYRLFCRLQTSAPQQVSPFSTRAAFNQLKNLA